MTGENTSLTLFDPSKMFSAKIIRAMDNKHTCGEPLPGVSAYLPKVTREGEHLPKKGPLRCRKCGRFLPGPRPTGDDDE